MSERPEPDLDEVREAMREHDERAAEDEAGEPPAEPSRRDEGREGRPEEEDDEG
jgi:hypothetical protein